MSTTRRYFLTLVRHGETALNRAGLVQGQGVDARLNETGKAQARSLGKRLRNESYALIYSSDLSRARETCELIVVENLPAANGTGAGTKDIIMETKIRERCYGVMEGRKREEFYSMAKSFGKTQASFVPEGAETIAELGDRAESFFLGLSQHCFDMDVANDLPVKNDKNGPNVLVVSHGRLIATFLSILSEKYGCSFPSGKLGVVPQNTAISCFEINFTKQFIENSNEMILLPNALNVKCTSLNSSSHLVE